MRYPDRMPRSIVTFSALFAVVAACADDPHRDPQGSDASEVTPDTLEPDTGAELGPDTLEPDTTVEPDTMSEDLASADAHDAEDTSDTVIPDATPDATTDTGFPELSYAEVLLDPDPSFDPNHVPLGDQVVTTLTETLRPRYGRRRLIDDEGRLLVPVEALGHLDPQPGEPHLLRDQLAMPPVDWTPGALPEGSRSLLFGLVLADPQLVDQDSPAQVHKNASRTLAGVTLPAYTPQGELGPHINDALVRSADRFQDDRLLDVVVIAGDHIENTQENELVQLHAVLSGGELTSDSGAMDDPIPGPNNDAYDPFIAGGFRPGTPWISSIGNHDVNIEGNFPVGLVAELNQTPDLRAQLDALGAPLGVTFPYEPTADRHPALFPHALRSAFRVEPAAFHPAMMTTPDELQSLAPGPTPPDPARAPMGVCGFIEKTFDAPGDPPGHGYSASNVSDCTGFYVYDPIPGLPLRILALDLGPHEGGSNGILAPPQADGQLDTDKAGDPTYDQIAFLEAALDDAEAEGVAVIVLTHQASDAIVLQSQLQDLAFLLSAFPELQDLIDRHSPIPAEAFTPEAFRDLLARSPAVIAHIAGHNHENRVRAICPDATTRAADEPRCEPGDDGATGYWEITTASGIDFPHQARFFEVIHVGQRLGALYLTIQEPRVPAGSFTERARFISVVREQLGSGRYDGLGELGDRNLLLPFLLSEATAANWEGQGEARIESETSLRGAQPPLPSLPEWP